MEHRISVLFYARNSKKNSTGLSPIYIRITVNGQRLDQSIQRYIAGNLWSAAAGRVKGNTEQARQVNLYLDTLTGKVLKLEREMVLDSIPVTYSLGNSSNLFFCRDISRVKRPCPFCI